MTSTPSLDVVIPHYGDPGLLAQAIESVTHQSDDSWTLTVVDDSDSPEVARLVQDLAPQKGTYASNPVRLGVAGNFQRCLDLARSPWVVFLGYDDRLLPDYVANVRRCAARHPQVSAIMPTVEVISYDGHGAASLTDRAKTFLRARSGPDEVRSGERLMTSLMHGNWTYFPATAWRLESIRPHGFRQDLPTTLDLALLAEVVLAGQQIAVTSGTDFQYRRHPRSASALTAATAERFAEEALLLDELAERSAARQWPRSARAARLRVTSRLHSALLVPSALTEGEPRVGRRLLRHTFGAA